MKPSLFVAIVLTVTLLTVAVLHRHGGTILRLNQAGNGGHDTSPDSVSAPVADLTNPEVCARLRKEAIEALLKKLREDGHIGDDSGAGDLVLRATASGHIEDFQEVLTAVEAAPDLDAGARFQTLAAVTDFLVLTHPRDGQAVADERMPVLAAAMGRWATADLQAADHWVMAAPATSVSRGAAIPAFATQAQVTQPDAALRAARLLPEGSERENLLDRLKSAATTR